MRRNIIIIVVILVAVFTAFRIFQYVKTTNEKKNKKPEERIVVVKTFVVSRQDMKEIVKVTGDISGKEEVNVFAKVPGKLIEKVKKEGDRVSRDEIVALLDRDEPGMKYSTAGVKAPISGVVFSYYNDIGDFVMPQAPLFKMGTIEKVKVVAYFSENEISKIKKGLDAVINADAYPDMQFSGKISSVSPVLDPMTRKLRAEIEINNEKHFLKPGMFAQVQIITDVHKNAIVVPIEAVIENGDTKTVFVAKDNLSHEVSVKIGILGKEGYEIIDGLKDGDEVVVQGTYGLKEGMKIKVQ
jgi:membrane fusion protein, multidrug efflux system